MLFAHDSLGNPVSPSKEISAVCPGCGAQVVAKCGGIMTHHWAHKAKSDCSWLHEPETDWHRSWKREMLIQVGGAAEVRFNYYFTGDSPTYLTKVTDFHFGQLAVEFQHSSISEEEIQLRESYYSDCHTDTLSCSKLIWVIDVRDVDSNFEDLGSYAFRWKHPRLSWLTSLGSKLNSNVQIVLDFGYKLWAVGSLRQWETSAGSRRVYGTYHQISRPGFHKMVVEEGGNLK